MTQSNLDKSNAMHQFFTPLEQASATPLSIVALVSKAVAKTLDRITGDRFDSPLLVATATGYALSKFGISSNQFYGYAAWIELTSDHQPYWAGCWKDQVHFWTTTRFGEIVDLSVGVSHRKSSMEIKPLLSAPNLWSKEVPSFYRYQPQGLVELELEQKKDQQKWIRVKADLDQFIDLKLSQDFSAEPSPDDFFNEAIIAPGKRLLDDSQNTFKNLDRALSIRGLPKPPEF